MTPCNQIGSSFPVELSATILRVDKLYPDDGCSRFLQKAIKLPNYTVSHTGWLQSQHYSRESRQARSWKWTWLSWMYVRTAFFFDAVIETSILLRSEFTFTQQTSLADEAYSVARAILSLPPFALNISHDKHTCSDPFKIPNYITTVPFFGRPSFPHVSRAL